MRKAAILRIQDLGKAADCYGNTQEHRPMAQDQYVYIVDDDDAVREAISCLIASVGHQTQAFPGAEQLLASLSNDAMGCIITDLRMRGMSGVELQAAINARGLKLPIIMVSAYASTHIVVTAMRNGAVTMLEKPFGDQELLDAVNAGLARSRAEQTIAGQASDVLAKLESLTPGELEVMDMVIKGAPNKAIAYDLGVSIRTVESRRHKILKKFDATSVAELVQIVVEARRFKESA